MEGVVPVGWSLIPVLLQYERVDLRISSLVYLSCYIRHASLAWLICSRWFKERSPLRWTHFWHMTVSSISSLLRWLYRKLGLILRVAVVSIWDIVESFFDFKTGDGVIGTSTYLIGLWRLLDDLRRSVHHFEGLCPILLLLR